jgi:molecular chaperone DnaK
VADNWKPQSAGLNGQTRKPRRLNVVRLSSSTVTSAMDDIVGIDLGTTNSLIGILEAGFPILLADAEGNRLTPSVVFFPEDGEPVVGKSAQRMRVVRPDSTVYSVKRFMGLRGEDVTEGGSDVAYQIDRRKGHPVTIVAGGQNRRPEKISSVILKKLKQDAERALGRPVGRAVITVPAYFNDAQRNATKRAGELAGFSVERILNEPTAAALAYGLDRLQSRSKIAVYDLGGGTFDISILELNNGVFEVIATNGNTQLGGDDIDRAFFNWLRDRIEIDLSPESSARIRELAIEAKHRLSTESVATIELPFADNARSLTIRVGREDLEQIARPIIERTRGHCLRALADAKLKPSELDEVVLVGGATRMALVRALVEEIFGRVANTSQNPDEAIAIGATIQAGVLAGAVRDVLLLDVTPLSLGIETFGGLMNVIIPRNSTIPTKAGEMFTTAVSNQSSIRIKVLQGEREMARDNWPLGQFELPFDPAPKGVPRVGIQFEIDANGILHVLARDTKTGREKIIEMSSAVDVSDEAVEAMLSESLEHAITDVNERIWTETRLKAEEMLGALDAALSLAGDDLTADEREKVLGAADDVRNALQSNVVGRLKAANEKLDAETQHLASLVVQKALAK